MTKILSDRAQERSTFTIVGRFFERSNDPSYKVAITPNSATWSLQDLDGNYINNRIDVPLPIDSSAVITLFGDDLALDGNYPEIRRITIAGTYDSVFGSDLPFREQIQFQIENLVD